MNKDAQQNMNITDLIAGKCDLISTCRLTDACRLLQHAPYNEMELEKM
jgi:hypothetical protein